MPFEALVLSTSLELDRSADAPAAGLAADAHAVNPRLTVDLNATAQDGTAATQPGTTGLDADAAADADLDVAVPAPFASRGSQRWYVLGGGGIDVTDTDNSMWMVGLGFTKFIADGLSLDLEFTGGGFQQFGDNAYGFGFALIFRWHMFSKEDWTVFFEGGVGMLGTTDNVPCDASSFNFTPQVGLGYTHALDDGARLLLGVRWYHVSNARTFENNPGRDHLMGYAGVSFPH
ncbi:MAG: acyloxyacyl hydrolase [Planctomycetes bacterium]|nr:acyloxyacyl hydrolase [Planctomycetota bacterium]